MDQNLTAAHPEANSIGKVLRAVPQDPITYSDMSTHMAQFRQDKTGEARQTLLRRMEELKLGTCTTGIARGPHARHFVAPPIKFFRGPLTTALRELLAALRVPTDSWPGASAETGVSTEIPHLCGTGKRPASRTRPAAAPAIVDAAEKSERIRASELFHEEAEPRAPTDLRVETLLNTALEQSGPRIGGQPVQIKATARTNKKKGVWFQLRCHTCDAKTCQWSGRAEYDPSEKMLRAFQVPERPHGTRKQRQRASGRKAKGHGLILPMRERVLYTEAVRRDSFHAWVKQFFASKPLQESIKVFCKPRPRKGGFTCIFGCLTHERCRWQGTAQLETDAAGDTYYVVLRHAEESVHSRKDRVIANTLTWLQRQVIFRSRSSLTRQAQNALKKLKRRTPDGPQQVTPPQAQKLDGFMKRFRRQMRQPQFEPGARQMDASVFQYCIDCANASLGGPSQVAPDDARIRCDDPRIRVLSPCLTPTELTMPLLCPALVRDVLDLLPQPWRLHLSLDGTYRLLLFKRYVLLNVGVNVKHWTGSKKPADVGPAFRTRYIPMAFAIAHVEASASYSSMVLCLLTLCRAAASLQGRAFTDKQITQWHGDLHKGLDKARAKVAPSSVRLSDWAHCCGVTSPGPSGFPALAASHLVADDPLRRRLVRWFHLSRFAPAMIFHCVWQSLFTDLPQSLLTSLHRDYFFMDGDGCWSAHWRAAPDRVAPGSATGSAAQESWHGKTLKQVVSTTTPHGLTEMLQTEIVEPLLAELAEMKRRHESFQDWPGAGQQLDLSILKGRGPMTAQGRSCAASLRDWGLHQRYDDAAGNSWFLVPVSRLRPSHLPEAAVANAKQQYLPRDLAPLPPGCAQHMAQAALASDAATAERALEALGVYDAVRRQVSDWTRLQALLQNWRLVVMGPAVQATWASHGVDAATIGNKHALCLCFFCQYAGTQGPCEHAYAVMLEAGHISMEGLPSAERRAGRPTQRPAPRAALSTPAGGENGAVAEPTPSAADPLVQLISAAGLEPQLGRFRQAGATVEMLRSMSMSDFHTFFGLTLPDAFRLKGVLDTPSASRPPPTLAEPLPAARPPPAAKRPQPKVAETLPAAEPLPVAEATAVAEATPRSPEVARPKKTPEKFLQLRMLYDHRPRR